MRIIWHNSCMNIYFYILILCAYMNVLLTCKFSYALLKMTHETGHPRYLFNFMLSECNQATPDDDLRRILNYFWFKTNFDMPFEIMGWYSRDIAVYEFLGQSKWEKSSNETCEKCIGCLNFSDFLIFRMHYSILLAVAILVNWRSTTAVSVVGKNRTEN